MKPPKWPRAPPPASLPLGHNAPAARHFWAFGKQSPDNNESTDPDQNRRGVGPNRSTTDFSHLRYRKAPRIDEQAISRKRQEWPLLRRRGEAPRDHHITEHTSRPRHRKPFRNPRHRSAFPQDDAAFARLLARAGPSKAEFDAAYTPPGSGFGRAEIDWSKLEAAAPQARRGDGGGDVGFGWGQGDGDGEGLTAEEKALQAAEIADTKKDMLLIRGVSTSLMASDFHRIAPKSLANWSSSIKKVEQQRDPQTMKPLGCYQVSFASAVAAQSYAENLNRLQRLAQHRMSLRSGLWEGTVPPHLLRPGASSTAEDVARDLQTLTIASPSQGPLYVKRSRTKTQYPWRKELQDLIQGCGYGEKPPVVVLSISPGRITQSDLVELIKEDGKERELTWKASAPIPLWSQPKPSHLSRRQYKLQWEEMSTGDTHGTPANEWDSQDSLVATSLVARFVLAFESDWEARSFHRSWHQRPVQTYSATSRTHQDVSTASVEIIEW